ncbi:hypothetical protein QJS10_CPB19g01952 [Acorus calamus]|uniref:Pectinesterase inhibitor domain-containing protein n=1 Tax=Acorus calamus TaxID=4465 RepID=A0AAV9CFD5_ACOCL|nr:hypothetical protein QJS10_CPB19g01952 [Acorus calamus]
MEKPQQSLLTLTLLLLLFISTTSASSTALYASSCSHARYPSLCVRTLSAFAGTSAQTPSDVARAAVSAALSAARNASSFLSSAASTARAGRQGKAIRDCVEQISDSVDELSETLTELRRLHPGTFKWQMGNAETWVSAALTNDDTCLDGVAASGDAAGAGAAVVIKRRISGVARVTSNALYLVNRLASSRGKP